MLFNAVSVVPRGSREGRGKPTANLSSRASCFCMDACGLRWGVSPGQSAASQVFSLRAAAPGTPKHRLPSGGSLSVPKPRGPRQGRRHHCSGKRLLSKLYHKCSQEPLCLEAKYRPVTLLSLLTHSLAAWAALAES